jgi:hypothetical protein
MNETTENLILESGHTFVTYTSLVPGVRMLKWADVMMQAAEALEASTDRDRERLKHVFYGELKSLVFDPIEQLGSAIVQKLNTKNPMDPQDLDKEVMEHVKSLATTIDQARKEKISPDSDVIKLKRIIIKKMNALFAKLNENEGNNYPEIPPLENLIPKAMQK